MARVRRLAGALLTATVLGGCGGAALPTGGNLGATSSLYLPGGDLSISYRYALAARTQAPNELDLVVEAVGKAKGAFDDIRVAIAAEGFEVVSGAAGELVSEGLRASHGARLRLIPGTARPTATVTLSRAGTELARERFTFTTSAPGLRACDGSEASCGPMK